MLRVRLLGELGVEVDGTAVAPPAGRPVRALLAWLALHPGRHARADVAAALWPDVLDRSARASLRTALSAVRQSLGAAAGALSADRDTVALAAGVDALEFASLVEGERYEEALALGDADLLAGFQDEWALLARDAHRERRGDALGALAAAAAERGEHAEAVRLARRRTALDPFGEPAHRELMRHLVASGDVAGAVSEYERLAARLRGELAVTPSAATRELAEGIRAAHGAAGGPPEGPGDAPPFPALLAPARFAGAFVGRPEALERLRRAWADVRGGARRAALIAGPPGIGKTRLAATFAADVHAAGGAVLAGVADEESPEPLSPLLGALAGAGRPPPELPDPGADPRAARLARLDALAEALERAAAGAPLLLVLDDLQWADEETLRLLGRLARGGSGPLLILATARPAAPAGVRAALDHLGRALPTLRLDLGGLGRSEVAALAADRGVEADLDGLLLRTAGNPFFLEALLAEGGAGTPARVIEAVAVRAIRLGEESLAVLGAAALLGRTIDPELAARVAGVDPLAALDALDGASGAGLVDRGASGDAVFAHALVQDALLDGLTAGDQARLHARAAEALLPRADAGDGAALTAAARHALAGSPPIPATDAIALAIRAAGALLAPAPGAAAELLERALARATAAGEAGTADELRCRLGEALAAAERPEDARAAFGAAAAGARGRGDGELLARTALGAAGPGVTILRVDDERVADLDDALTALGPGTSALHVRLRARLAIELAYAPEPERREQLSAGAVEAARALGDHRSVAAALGARHVVLWGPEHTSERLSLADEMLASARRAGDPALELQARTWRIVDLTELGDGAALDAEIDAYAAAAARSGLSVYGWYVPAWRATRATLEGRWEEASRLVDRAVALGERAGDGNAALVAKVWDFQRAISDEGLADVDLEWIEERMRTSPAGWAYRNTYVWVLAARGREADARAALGVLRAAGGPSAWPRDTNWISSALELAEAVWLLGERELGAELSSLLAPLADRIVSSTRGLHVMGPVAGALARLDDLLGDREAAAARYEDSIARSLRAGAPVFAARDRRRLGELLCERGDSARGSALLGEAAAEARALGLGNVAAACERALAAPQRTR